MDTLSDHSVDAASSIEVPLGDFRKMLHGEHDKEWVSFSRAMDDHDYWKYQKGEWRRAAQGDAPRCCD
eukprot:3254067-Pyramimonas_sp.AAC.1